MLLLYSFDSGISPYASYSQAITPSLFPDAQQKLLKPMTSEQYEVGIKYQPLSSSTLYSAAVYDLTQNDVANFYCCCYWGAERSVQATVGYDF